MNAPKERRRRKKLDKYRAEATARMKKAAQEVWGVYSGDVVDMRFCEEGLVHQVVCGSRSFSVATNREPMWVSRVIWATACQRVLHVGRAPKFSSSKKVVTCISCWHNVHVMRPLIFRSEMCGA